jgi:hypothetical protein
MTGTYTEIVEIVAPSSAVAGSTVNVEVKIKNRYSASVHIYCVGVLDSQTRFIDWQDAWVSPGQTQSFYGSFIMPSQSVTLNIYSYYEAVDGYLYSDDSKSKAVSVTEAVAGKISRKELDYEDRWQAFALYNIPTGTRTRVRITGRNDMTTTQRMGIYWIVKDPDGIVVEEYSAWEAWPYTGAGAEHEFIGGSFDLNKVGTYTINAGLLMNPDAPVYVDIYYGNLCTVAAELVPTFSEFAVASFSKV